MKRTINAIVVAGIMLLAALPLAAQGNPRGTAKLALSGKAVSVEYGRPSLKGRTVDALLGRIKPGGVWRLGADTSTTFTSEADLSFGSVTVPKGAYSLWARQEAGGWKLVFNKQHGQWGTEYDAAQDLAAAPLSQTKLSKSVEQFTLSLGESAGGGLISLQWGDLGLSANFKAK